MTNVGWRGIISVYSLTVSACWDTPPPVDSALYPAFKRALTRYLGARLVEVPVLSIAQAKQRDSAAKTMNQPPEEQPNCIVGGVSDSVPLRIESHQMAAADKFFAETHAFSSESGRVGVQASR